MNDYNLKYCIIIPCYEKHAYKLEETITGLSSYSLDFIVVDDGSSEKYSSMIRSISEKFKAHVIRINENEGKGSAMKHGFRYAYANGYSHGLQIDADGQHDFSSVAKIIKASKERPNELISGTPVYDESIPKSRMWGRYITHFWVWIETLGFSIKDSMCGFRSYPLKETIKVINSSTVGNRMDFDTEIMVRLYWNKVPSNFVNVKVHYPEDGVSYFNMLEDNILITKMHTRLFFGMVFRFPWILLNKFKMIRWNQIDEKGISFLIKITLWIHDVLGNRISRLLLYVISVYYYIFSMSARRSSSTYIKIYKKFVEDNKLKEIKFNPLTHIYSFSNMLLDKFDVWKKKITFNDFNADDIEKLREIKKSDTGALFISSHYGNIELIRALGKHDESVKYNVLFYTKNSKKIINIFKEIDPDFEDRIIPIDEFSPDMAIQFMEKISKGEWLFCMGDRISAQSNKSIKSKLLGKEVSLPMGPFLMGYLLDAPVYSIHCYKGEGEYRLSCRELSPNIEKSKQHRDEIINTIAGEYIKDLEKVILKDPRQWFNFYDYWKEE